MHTSFYHSLANWSPVTHICVSGPALFQAVPCRLSVTSLHLTQCWPTSMIPKASYDDVTKWNHFPCHWPFVREIHRATVYSLHKSQWCGALMFSLICAWINGWANTGDAGDLRRHRVHYDATVMHLSTRYIICVSGMSVFLAVFPRNQDPRQISAKSFSWVIES